MKILSYCLSELRTSNRRARITFYHALQPRQEPSLLIWPLCAPQSVRLAAAGTTVKFASPWHWEMADNLSLEQRHRTMRRVKSKHTQLEMDFRRALHSMGFRYRLHARYLPGTPDLVLPKYRTVIFVNGCFWHAHNCPRAKLPVTRRDFWEEKINANKARDARCKDELYRLGWHVIIVWECDLRKGKEKIISAVADQIQHYGREA